MTAGFKLFKFKIVHISYPKKLDFVIFLNLHGIGPLGAFTVSAELY